MLESFREVTRSYDKAFALYEQGKFTEAETLFRKLSMSDRASKIFSVESFACNPNNLPPNMFSYRIGAER